MTFTIIVLIEVAIFVWLWLAIGGYLVFRPAERPYFFRWIFCHPDPWGLKGEAINARKE